MLLGATSLLLICGGFALLWAILAYFGVRQLLNKINKEAQKPDPTKKINPQVYAMPMENTMAVLNDVVQQQLVYHLEYNIKAFGPAYINDKTLENVLREIITDIYAVLSPDYVELLNHYFSEDGLTTYIYRTIYPAVLQVSLQKNEIK